jgi:hypothetical protein
MMKLCNTGTIKGESLSSHTSLIMFKTYGRMYNLSAHSLGLATKYMYKQIDSAFMLKLKLILL